MSLFWITGASSGLGRALALRLARDGAAVAASARRREALEALADEAQGTVIPAPVDVTDRAATAALVERLEAAHGPIDVAVLAAGMHEPMTAAKFDAGTMRRLVEVNLMGVAHALEALIPRMTARGAGRIAVLSSVAGYRGLPTAAAYGATKAAVINLCEALKFDLDAAGVQIQLVNPGFVRTPLTDRNPFPMPFLMEPEDAAERVARGLRSGRFEITFPRRFTWPMKALRSLPYGLYFPMVRRITGWPAPRRGARRRR